MIDIEEFIKFVEKERLTQETEIQTRDLLSGKALVYLGHAISDLKVTNRSGDTLTLQCSQNISRFRPGDRLVFRHELLSSFRATLFDLTDQGRTLSVRGRKLPDAIDTEHWIATEDTSNLTYTIVTGLRKLRPGAPGWLFVKRLLGDGQISGIKTDPEHKILLDLMTNETGLKLDESQTEIFLRCLSLPTTFGVQGPPGTGKTLVLAFVVEALMRSGKRVVLLAPTHQAVNNALTTVHQMFPGRKVKKFGDELRTESLAHDIPIITSPLKIKQESASTLIGLTFMSAMHHLIISDQKMLAPNVVVIDEAGQLPLVQGICAGLSGAGSILLFGDDKQMPPVFAGDLSEEPLAVSVFSQLRTSQPGANSMLSITYRMNESLCRSISSIFYKENPGSPLIPSNDAGQRIFPSEFEKAAQSRLLGQALSPEKSLVWLQVPSRNCMQYNPWEAQVAADIVVICLKAGLSSKSIAVVTPFRRQVMSIRKLITAQLGDEQEPPIVDTVERVQGLTVEAVVVSLCASELDYVGAIADFLFSPNRLNVAVSRARSKAIVISSPDISNALPQSYSGLLARIQLHSFLNSPDCRKVMIE